MQVLKINQETQAGGYPTWLVAKRNIRIRHANSTLFRKFDPEFSLYCKQWYQQILGIFKPHQITNGGCIIALQIENELFESLASIPIGLSDDMRFLCQTARDLGITIPFFTNDGFEVGSFNPGVSKFGIDLYGFDKYVIFVPVSSISAIVFGTLEKTWKDWSTAAFSKSLDYLETTVRSFGGGARSSPIFIPELQGGWFNHYTCSYGYDDIYKFYGQDYTKTIIDTVSAQGCNFFNIYMFYGGTNYGYIGDPDVYTSYDYSACIRENRSLSGKARLLRLSLAFIQSFSDIIASDSISAYDYSTSPKNCLISVRQSTTCSTRFLYYRNFTKNCLYISVKYLDVCSLNIKLLFKKSLISIANHKFHNLEILLSTMLIVCRVDIDKTRYLFIQNDSTCFGEILFKNRIEFRGTLVAKTEFFKDKDEWVTKLSLNEGSGWLSIFNQGSDEVITLVALNLPDLYTFAPKFNQRWSNNGESSPSCITWGTERSIDADTFMTNSRDSLIFNFKTRINDSFIPIKEYKGLLQHKVDPFIGLNDIWIYEIPTSQFTFNQPINQQNLKSKTTSFKSFNWEPLESTITKSTITPKLYPLDFGYTCGHSFYRVKFHASSLDLIKMTFNTRHKTIVYLNNQVIGSSLTYSLRLFAPGSKQGPDRGGSVCMDLSESIIGVNEMIFVVESFGINRQVVVFDDVRNPRGLIDLKLSGDVDIIGIDIAGVDVRCLSDVFNISGFPDENLDSWVDSPNDLEKFEFVNMPEWFRFEFTVEKSMYVRALRAHVNGDGNALIWLNEVLIGRYYHLISPQSDFYFPEGLLKDGVNRIQVLYYNSKPSSIKLEIKEYRRSSGVADSLEDLWSGNLDESGESFFLKKIMF